MAYWTEWLPPSVGPSALRFDSQDAPPRPPECHRHIPAVTRRRRFQIAACDCGTARRFRSASSRLVVGLSVRRAKTVAPNRVIGPRRHAVLVEITGIATFGLKPVAVPVLRRSYITTIGRFGVAFRCQVERRARLGSIRHVHAMRRGVRPSVATGSQRSGPDSTDPDRDGGLGAAQAKSCQQTAVALWIQRIGRRGQSHRTAGRVQLPRAG
jgi:hypothetical protein